MGIEDREYYWKDRKRREEKFNKKNTCFSSKEPRKKDSTQASKFSSHWKDHNSVFRMQWRFLIVFFAGGFVSFWSVMIILNLNADLLYVPYDMVKRVLATINEL